MKLFKLPKKALSIWKKIPEIKQDQILYFNELFKKDPWADKVNLTVGQYLDEDGKPWVLQSVQESINQIKDHFNFSYLNPKGDQEFVDLAVQIAYGNLNKNELENLTRIQSLSGAGGLMLLFQFLKKMYQPLEKLKNIIYIPSPSWPLHSTMVLQQELRPEVYDYYDLQARNFDFKKLFSSLQKIPEYSPVIFHPIGHNPTGFDPSTEQWVQIAELCGQKKFFCIFDTAYQGFVSGDPESDAFVVRLFYKSGLPMAIVQSFAKNFGLYNARIGCLSIPMANVQEAALANEFIGHLVRTQISNSPAFGSEVIKNILKNDSLKTQWYKDMEKMSGRIKEMRHILYDELKNLGSKQNWDYLVQQKGMFSFTQLQAVQIKKLREEFGVYMLESGRISIPGLNKKNVNKVAQGFHLLTK